MDQITRLTAGAGPSHLSLAWGIEHSVLFHNLGGYFFPSLPASHSSFLPFFFILCRLAYSSYIVVYRMSRKIVRFFRYLLSSNQQAGNMRLNLP